MAEVTPSSTLYAGSVTDVVMYHIARGEGFKWGPLVRTEFLMDKKPRELTKAKDEGAALQANIENPRQTDFSSSTWTTTIDGNQLSVVDYIALKQINADSFRNTFPRYQPDGLQVDLQINPEIREVVMKSSLEYVQSAINNLHSSGDTGGTDLYDGFSTIILADADATQVGTPTVITTANAVDLFFDLRDAVDPRLMSNPNLKIICSHADARIFDRASRATNTAEVVTLMDGVKAITDPSGSNIPVIPVEGIPKDFVFITIAGNSSDSNLVQGVWMENDMETLSLYKEQPVDQIWNLVFRTSLGVQIVTGEDIWYLNNI